MGLVSVSVLVSETAGKIHLSDNMRCKGHRRTFLRIVARILPRSSSRSLVFRFDGLLCECICLCLFVIVVYLFAHIHQV